MLNSPIKTQSFRISIYGTIHHFKIHPTLPNVFYQYGNDHDLSLWDIHTSQLIQKFKGNKHQITVAILSKSNKFKVIISANGEVFCYTESEIPKKILLPEGFIPLNGLLVESANQTLLLITTTKPEILVYSLEAMDADIGIFQRDSLVLPNQQDQAQWITEITLQNNRVYGFQKEMVDIWVYEDDKFSFVKESQLVNCQGYVMAYCFYSLGQQSYLAIGDSSGQLLVYSMGNNELKFEWKHKMVSAVLQVQQVALKNGEFLIAGTFDDGLDVLDMKGSKVQAIEGRSAPFIWWNDQNILLSRSAEHTHFAMIDQY